jgi:hypothetical protein
MVIAIGIAVVLVVAAIGGLAARVMMGPEEMALLRAARAAAAQRRLVAAATQQDDWIRRCLERLYEDALAAPLSPRLHSSLNSKHRPPKRGSRIILRQGARVVRNSG